MNCIEMICMYLKKYISSEQFENIFFDSIDDFQDCLEEDIYLDILTVNISSKEEKISLETKLYNYILSKYKEIYESINDAYVEHIVDLDKQDIITEILKKKYEKRKEVYIDCSIINTRSEMITAIKKALLYPKFCGDNWYAIEDLIYDIIFPEKLIFYDWSIIEERLPQDAAILKKILDRNNDGRCVIIYAS